MTGPTVVANRGELKQPHLRVACVAIAMTALLALHWSERPRFPSREPTVVTLRHEQLLVLWSQVAPTGVVVARDDRKAPGIDDGVTPAWGIFAATVVVFLYETFLFSRG